MSFPQAFVDPSSVAVVGATEDRAKWGYWLATGALAGAGRRQVWLVNRRSAQVLGQSCRPTVDALPQAPDLVALCVPPRHVLPVVRDALAKGAAHSSRSRRDSVPTRPNSPHCCASSARE